MKIDKIMLEMEKTKAKVSEFQTKFKELERRKIEQENIEIVNLVRALNLNATTLKQFVKSYNEETKCRELELENEVSKIKIESEREL